MNDDPITFQILFLSIQRNVKLKLGDHNIRKQGRHYKRSIQKFGLQLVFAIVSDHLYELIIFFLAGIVMDDITVKDVFSLPVLHVFHLDRSNFFQLSSIR